MEIGEVFYNPNYEFSDGSVADKLIINLSSPLPNEPYLVVLTTSKQKRRINKSGCHSCDGYYVIPQEVDFFDRPFTWVLFHTIKEFTLKQELEEGWVKRNIIKMGVLKEITVKAIINCLKNSRHLTPYQRSLLR